MYIYIHIDGKVQRERNQEGGTKMKLRKYLTYDLREINKLQGHIYIYIYIAIAI